MIQSKKRLNSPKNQPRPALTAPMAIRPIAPPTTMPGRNATAATAHHAQRGAVGSDGARCSCARAKSHPYQNVRNPPTAAKDHHGSASFLAKWPPSVSSVLKISTARDGVMVTALIADMIVETAIVTANW